MARVMLDEEQAKGFLAGAPGKPVKKKGGKAKPVSKGKKRRTEIQHDADLEGAMTKHTAEKARPRQEHISAAPPGFKIVMEETMARVYEEIWPSMQVRNDKGVDAEIAEEAYILSLMMVVGDWNEKGANRKPVPLKEHELKSSEIGFCKEHDEY